MILTSMKAYSFRHMFLVSGLITVMLSCAYTWQGNPRNIEPYEMCDPQASFPQMIQLPVLSKAWQVVYSCGLHRREPVAIAVSMFYMEWYMTFGDPHHKVWDAVNGIMIDWSPEARGGSAYDIGGKHLDTASYGGLALSQSYVWVKPHHGEIICESALIHELVHISIWAIKGTDGDPDHMGDVYSGWSVDHSALIQRMNDTLCALGI